MTDNNIDAKKSLTTLLIMLVVGLIIILSTIFTVQEGQKAIRLRLGKIVASSQDIAKVAKPGLHFKLPLIETVKYFDVRLQTFDMQSSRILTKEQKYVLVDYYVKWKIDDVPAYYTRTGGFSNRAQQLLQQKANNALRAAFGTRSITEVVSGERGEIMSTLKNKLHESARSLGISVIDFRIKRIDLPKEVSLSVHARMRAERERVATKHRSYGRAEAERIRAKADAKVTVIKAQAKMDAAKIKAIGLSKAAAIYSVAYRKDASFYSFYRSLQAYLHSFNAQHNNFLVLNPKTEFFRFFRSQNGKK